MKPVENLNFSVFSLFMDDVSEEIVQSIVGVLLSLIKSVFTTLGGNSEQHALEQDITQYNSPWIIDSQNIKKTQ